MSSRRDLRKEILNKQLGKPYQWRAMDPPPILHPEYVDSLQRVNDKLHTIIVEAEAVLQPLSQNELNGSYDENGDLKNPEMKSVWEAFRERLEFVGEVSPIYRAGLGNPHYAADFDYWSRMERLHVEEVLWLSIGFSPKADWDKALALGNRMPPREHRARTYVLAQREQLERFAETNWATSSGFRGPELLEWIVVTGFPAHPGMIEAVRKIASRCEGTPLASAVNEHDAKAVDRREIVSMAKLVTAIAMQEYGYQPNGKRSPIPKEIQDICDEKGLPVSRETILKYLRLGAEHLLEEG